MIKRVALDKILCFIGIASVIFNLGYAAPTVCHTPSEASVSGIDQSDAGADYIFVVDSTDSMNYKISGAGGQTRWDELKSKLIDNVSRIQAEQGYRLHLLVFGGAFTSSLNWLTAPNAPVSIPNDKTSAYSFVLKSEADKNVMVQSVSAMTKPSAMSTPVRDAVKAAFEKALSLKANGSQKIVIAVFSDGDDNSSKISKAALEEFVGKAQSSLGDALIGSSYLFIRVAGLNIATPTKNASRTVDHTPSFATINLLPASIDAGSLAVQEETDWIEMRFQASGLNAQAVPLYFEPASGAPRVQIVCQCGKSPVYGTSGHYRIKFRRAAPASAYEKNFEGVIKLDDRDLSPPGSRTVVQNLSRSGIRVRFAGAPRADLSRSEVKPSAGTRVLVGQSIRFEAPSRVGAKYNWSFSGSNTASIPKAVFEYIFLHPGFVDVELKLEQPGYAVSPVTFKVEVVDPALKINATPANPVEGETVHLKLDSNSSLKIRSVQWLPSAQQMDGKSADYIFSGTGSKSVSALVDTELGQAVGSITLSIKPGMTAPELVVPQPQPEEGNKSMIRLFKVSEPQKLEAEADEGTGSVAFRITQSGREIFSAQKPVSVNAGRRGVIVNLIAGSFAPGAAVLTLTSIPTDPELTSRLGVKSSEYIVLIEKSTLSMVKQEPTSAEIEWGKPVSFITQLSGPGLAKITGVDWKVAVVSKDGTRIELPGRLQSVGEFTNDTLSSFEFTPERSNPRLANLRDDASIEVRAIPQGDPAIVENMSAVWTGLSPKFAPADFVIVSPKHAILDERIKLKIFDSQSGNTAESVSWHMVGENSDPLSTQTGAEQQVVVTSPGSHTVKATVKWAGGEQVCAEQSFYVDFQPLTVSEITWDGGKKPAVEHWGKKESDTVTIKGKLLGSRAGLVVDLKKVVNGRLATSAPGYPKQKTPSDLAHGFGLEYPKATTSTEEYAATLVANGLNAQGEPTAVAGESFRIINHPSVLVPIIVLLLITGSLMWFIRHISTNNVGKYYGYVVLNSQNAVTNAFQGPVAKAGPDAGIFNQWRAFRSVQLKPVGTQSSSWITPGNGYMSGSWNFRSFRRKRTSISLNDDAAFPPALLPAWFKALQGRDAHLLFLFKDGEWLLGERLYEDQKATKPITDATESINDISGDIILPSWPCKKLYSIEGQSGNKVFVCLWDLSSEEQNEASLRSYTRYGMIANGILFVGFAAILMKFLT